MPASNGTPWRKGSRTCEARSSIRSGGALPGVAIVITNQASGTYSEVVSNADGSWYVPGLTPGNYQVSAELTGFRRFLAATCR